MIAAGSFTHFNGIARGSVVRLQNNGSVDEDFAVGDGANNTPGDAGILDLAVDSEGRILICGYMNAFDGLSRSGIARLLPNGSVDTEFAPEGPSTSNGTTPVISRLLALPDGAIMVAGRFQHFNAVPRNGIARLSYCGPVVHTRVDRPLASREPLQFTLTRETIRVSSVRTRLLEPGYAYLRIATFQANTGLDLERKLKDVVASNGAPLKGLVLDLRSNPGGLLNTAVEAADAFLDEGVIVSTRGRLPHSRSEAFAHKGDIIHGAPIAILVDGGTASAAEVLAGALRDHHRALVLGSTTFGKGSVQTVLPLDNGDSIKVTTARYYTPNGTSIQATGIVPDVTLEVRPQDYDDLGFQPPTLRERDLPGHLRGDNEDPESDTDTSAIPIQPLERPEELGDSGVREALNLLKGLSVFRNKGVDQKD